MSIEILLIVAFQFFGLVRAVLLSGKGAVIQAIFLGTNLVQGMFSGIGISLTFTRASCIGGFNARRPQVCLVFIRVPDIQI